VRYKMVSIKCISCGKIRALSKNNEKKILAKNNGDMELVKKEYLCRKCKKEKNIKK